MTEKTMAMDDVIGCNCTLKVEEKEKLIFMWKQRSRRVFLPQTSGLNNYKKTIKCPFLHRKKDQDSRSKLLLLYVNSKQNPPTQICYVTFLMFNEKKVCPNLEPKIWLYPFFATKQTWNFQKTAYYWYFLWFCKFSFWQK